MEEAKGCRSGNSLHTVDNRDSKIIQKGNLLYWLQQNLYKSFQNVEYIKTRGYSKTLVYSSEELFDEQKASARTELGETEWFSVGMGMRQDLDCTQTYLIYKFILYQDWKVWRLGSKLEVTTNYV